jgi:hypothetical protein
MKKSDNVIATLERAAQPPTPSISINESEPSLDANLYPLNRGRGVKRGLLFPLCGQFS